MLQHTHTQKKHYFNSPKDVEGLYYKHFFNIFPRIRDLSFNKMSLCHSICIFFHSFNPGKSCEQIYNILIKCKFQNFDLHDF